MSLQEHLDGVRLLVVLVHGGVHGGVGALTDPCTELVISDRSSSRVVGAISIVVDIWRARCAVLAHDGGLCLGGHGLVANYEIGVGCRDMQLMEVLLEKHPGFVAILWMLKGQAQLRFCCG